jgi:hypothetical protein
MLVALTVCGLFAAVILYQIRTGRSRGRNWQVALRREDDPQGFWISIVLQVALLTTVLIWGFYLTWNRL